MEASHWKDYFNFSKKERTGIITLLVLLVLTWFLPTLFPSAPTFNRQDVEVFKKEVALFDQETNAYNSAKENAATRYHVQDPSPPIAEAKTVLFYFDPNTLQANEWKKLGVKNKTISTILHYMSKGGKFYKPQDLSKIYGLSKSDYERLLPYVRIAEIQNKKELPLNATVIVQKTKPTEIKPININTTDTMALIALPGIGSKLANRIISFRQKLGGFYSVEQVAEVFGLPDSTFQKIKPKLLCNAGDIQKININAATLEQLKAHPYIKYQIGNAVIQYRNQHGNFQSVNDLKQIQAISAELFQKIVPYLSER